MSIDVSAACDHVKSALAEKAEPGKAAGMQAYMKTDMPFYGVQKPDRVPILRALVKDQVPETREEYEELVRALWTLPHREEKYLAQGVATAHGQFIVPDSLPLYRTMIVEGGWWDLVDEVATHMIRPLVIHFPEDVWPSVENWIGDEDMWLRRAAIICQVGAKDKTDQERLFRFCAALMHENEFFIRKAIGWALRDFGGTSPDAVARFVNANKEAMSGLTFREASKHLGDLVQR